jgi:hypothetical protein
MSSVRTTGRRIRLAWLGLAILPFLLPRPAAGQAVSGTILGDVVDTTGAVIPGANVTLVNTGTGFSRTVMTDSKGEYTAPSIPTGTYTVTAEMTGFKKVTMANVQLGVDQKVRIPLKLDLGQMTEVVEIQAETPLVQTSSSDLSATITEEQIKQLPLNGRNFVQLTRTVPGVLRGIPGDNIDGAGSLAWRASASFSANGQKVRDNNYLLDGVDNNETWLQSVVIFPSVDAIQEFKLQTSTYSAEFGRSMGGVVNLQIKSGSNEFHGSAFEFLRNDSFDANNWFNNRANPRREKPDFSQHQFGGTLGGPIIRGKTFFFVNYQGMRLRQGQTYLSTVPSERMRNGDFSEINRPIFDPLTGQPFPNNQIPQSRWDPAARNILNDLIPAPNQAGSRNATGQTINNYLNNPATLRQDNQFDVKVDHALSQDNRFFVRYSFQKTHRDQPATLPHGDAGFTFGAGDGNITAHSFALNDNHTISSNWLNEFRVGYSYIKFFMTSIDYGQNLANAVGIPGVNINDVTSAFSQIQFEQGGSRNLGANANQPLITNLGNLQIFDNVTHIRGAHTFKVGGSVTLRSREILNADNIVGQFFFSQNQTSNCAGRATGCTVNANTGHDVASFLLGAGRRKNRTLFSDQTYTERRPEWAAYVQDDWRVTPKLTVNLGLRWDMFVPWVEDDDRQSNYDPSTGLFVVASPNAVINGVQVGRHLQTWSKKDFGPRLGFAYDLTGDGKTLIRGGYGVFWNWGVGGTSSSKATNPPFLQATDISASGGAGLRLSEGLPAPPAVDATLRPTGSTRSNFDINYRDQYAMNWNLNVQRALGRDYMVEVAYVGSRARQLILKTNLNQAPPVLGVTNADVNRPAAALGSPGLRDVGTVTNGGTLDYHAFLFKGVKRYSNGFSLLTSYTFGKALDLVSGNDGGVTLANIFDPSYNRGPADYDVTHTFSQSFLYELPFAKNAWYGGWQFNGIGSYRTGIPVTITQTGQMASTGIGGGLATGQASVHPNRIGDGRAANQTIDQWFDPAAFQRVTETTATFGTSGRNILRGPSAWSIDMSLIKRTRFGKFDTELRAEAFNVLNHPTFGQPNGQLGNAAFGTITAMAAGPCGTCGTSERQIQLAFKVLF